MDNLAKNLEKVINQQPFLKNEFLTLRENQKIDNKTQKSKTNNGTRAVHT